jgi:hypothetical protein
MPDLPGRGFAWSNPRTVRTWAPRAIPRCPLGPHPFGLLTYAYPSLRVLRGSDPTPEGELRICYPCGQTLKPYTPHPAIGRQVPPDGPETPEGR